MRIVADRLAAQGYPALAVPLFARTAPDLELAYEASDLAKGDATRPTPPLTRFGAMFQRRSAGWGPATHRPTSMWWGSALGDIPLFLRPRCPGSVSYTHLTLPTIYSV